MCVVCGPAQVHETARLDGLVELGAGNIVEERAVLAGPTAGPPLRVGTGNRFETGCLVRAREIGDYNVFKAKSVVECVA